MFLVPFYWEKNNKILLGINRKTNSYPSKVFFMPARASFDILIKYLSYCTGSLYYISKKKNIQKKEEEEEKN